MDPSRELHQEMGITSNSLENIMVCSKAQQQEQQRKPRPQQEQALKCPRCDSTNTKFCYYNNYSLSQPRYFCKSCRRYWTKGGTLRNVPVGGGCRKNKRSSSSSSSKRSTSQDHHQPMMITSNNNPLSNLQYPSLSSYDCNDLSLAFARLQKQQQQQQQTCGFDQDEHDDDDGSNSHHQNLSILGNSISHLTNNNAHFENFLGNPNSSSISNFHEAPFHNFYYGGMENGNGGNGGEMMIPYHHHHQEEATTAAVVVSTMKQESEMNNNGRVLWGFPWQIGGSAEQDPTMVTLHRFSHRLLPIPLAQTCLNIATHAPFSKIRIPISRPCFIYPNLPLNTNSSTRKTHSSSSLYARRAGWLLGLAEKKQELPDTVKAGDPVLHEPAREVKPDEIGSDRIQKIIDDMVKVMRKAPGVGLAAPQIGIPLRIIVLEDTQEYISYAPKEETKAQDRRPFDLLVILNPKLKKTSNKTALFFEGCLSVDGFRAVVERYIDVEVTGFSRDGQPIKIDASGWQARILQHECDHLDGTLYVDKMIPKTFRAVQNLDLPLADGIPKLGVR